MEYLPGFIPKEHGQPDSIGIIYKGKTQGNKVWSFILVSILQRFDRVLTWITQGDTIMQEYAGGWLTHSPTQVHVVVTTSKVCDL